MGGDDAEACIAEGDRLADLREYTSAVACFARAAALDPGDEEAWTSLGVCYGKLKQLGLAEASYARAIEINAEDSDLLVYRGNVLSLLRRYDEAVACYTKAWELQPDLPGAVFARGNIRFSRSLEYGEYGERTRSLEAALKDYEATLAVDPEHTEARINQQHARSRLWWESANVCNSWGGTVPVPPPVYLEESFTVALPDAGPRHPRNPLHAVHCFRWLDAATCAALRADVEANAALAGGWTSARHKNHATCDFEASASAAVRDWLTPLLRASLVPTLGRCFGVRPECLLVREIFVVKVGRMGGMGVGGWCGGWCGFGCGVSRVSPTGAQQRRRDELA
jgi:tetratricopeptide (TPR) repeat protein